MSPVRRRRRTQNQQEPVRSSSCGDLPTRDFMHKKQTRFIIDRFVAHLTQIRARNANTVNGKTPREKKRFRSFIPLRRSGMLSSMEMTLKVLCHPLFPMRMMIFNFNYLSNLDEMKSSNFESKSFSKEKQHSLFIL